MGLGCPPDPELPEGGGRTQITWDGGAGPGPEPPPPEPPSYWIETQEVRALRSCGKPDWGAAEPLNPRNGASRGHRSRGAGVCPTVHRPQSPSGAWLVTGQALPGAPSPAPGFALSPRNPAPPGWHGQERPGRLWLSMLTPHPKALDFLLHPAEPLGGGDPREDGPRGGQNTTFPWPPITVREQCFTGNTRSTDHWGWVVP